MNIYESESMTVVADDGIIHDTISTETTRTPRTTWTSTERPVPPSGR